MDRLREANRRGSLSGGAQISSLRRPRSGAFKDSTAVDEDEAMEDLHSARLRERPRKDVSMLSASRHKRTRHASRELHSRIEVVEEAQGGEICASDEDDDVPISPNLLPRKPAKLRFHGKVTPEEGNAVEIPTVPRKARTAISKRSHESFQGDSTRQHSSALTPQLSSFTAPPPGPALKPMKRMKHNGPKVKTAKHTKVSTSVSISEQEVEVAEALFDLARMVSNMGSPLCNDDTKEGKMENGESKGTAWLNSPESTPTRRQDSISTPPSSHSAVSSPVRGPAPVSSLYIPASEAPVRKISLSKLKIEDGTHSRSKNDLSVPVKGVMDSTGQSVGLKIMSTKDNGLTGQGPHRNAAAPVSLLPNQFSQTTNINVSVTDVKTKIPLDSALGSDAPPKSDSSYLIAFLEQKQECGKELKTPDACDSSALSKEKKLKTSYLCKDEIDLMAAPNASASGAIETNGNNVDSIDLGANKLAQEWDKVSYINKEKHDSQPPVDACTVKEEAMSSGTEKESRKHIKLSEDVKEENSRENERTQQVVKQEFPVTVKNRKPDLMNQHTAGGSGWPGSLPHMGYYPSAAAAAAAAAAVAAAWPATGSVIGAASMEEKGRPVLQVPPFAFPSARPLCKRCATHVYIAHFIDTQQQMQRHPIWAAAYGNTATGGLYSMKPYSINAPLPPNTLFGGGLSGLTGLSVNNSPALKGFNPEATPQNDKGSAPGTKEKSTSLNMDGVDRKGASQSSQAGNQDQVTPLQAGLGPMFGYPLVGPSSVSVEAEGNNVLNKGTSAAGATAVVASHLEPVGASTSSNTDSVNVAAAQVQYLQAIIQQAGFPFSFSQGQLMPPTTGHLAQQQATHFYGNPFYNAPFVQQGSATGRITPKMSSPQGQSTSMHQDTHVSHSVSQQHHHQQQQLSSASSQSHQRIASQHLQHFGDRDLNLGGEVVSSAESTFPGYQKNMPSHETSIMHTSNLASSTSLHSSGMPILPAHVSLAGKQAVNMKLPLPQSYGQGQAQQPSQHLIPQYHSMGVKSMDFQSPQGSSNMLSGVVSKNMIGPGPLGLASVAAVMAPQGHTVLQTMADTQLSHHAYQEQSLQQTYSNFTTNANLEGSKTSTEISDEKRTPVKQAAPSCTLKMDIESESSSLGSLANKSGLTSMHMQQNFPGVSYNFLTSPVGNLGSRQGASVSIAPVSIGSITGTVPSSKPVAMGRANSTATAHESTALNKSTSSNVPLHVPSVSGHHGIRQGQAASQYSSQTKPISRTQVGTTCVSTAPSTLFQGSYTGVPNTKQVGYSAKNQQVSVSSMQSRFPPTASGSSSASASPSTSISKSNSNAAVKNTPPAGKASQKQALGKKPDALLTHSPGQVVGPHSMTVSMGQQQQQSQHQQIQHVIKQQQQWQQQPKQHHNLHQEHSQQGPQSMHHPAHVTGATPTATVQYHQASGTNQVGQAGVQKQSAQPQQMKQRLYLEQHFYQQQLQQQSQLTEPQHNARPSTQQYSAQHPVVSATNRCMQQPSELQHQQVNKHQVVSSHQQHFPLASFGTSSSGVVPHTSSSISIGNVSTGRPASSDGALMQVTSPKGNSSMKPPGGTGISVTGSNMQRSSTPSSGNSHVQGMGVKLTDAKLQPQSSSNISYLPYLHSATFSNSAATLGKNHGASFMHTQSGASVKSTREPSAGAGREDNSTMHQFNDRTCPVPIASLTSGNSHSSTVSATTNIKSSIPQLNNTDVRASSRATPLVVHGLPGSHVATASGQSSQTCTVTSASMTADSISTTG